MGFFDFVGRLLGRETRSAPPAPPTWPQATSGFSFSDIRKNPTVQAATNVLASSIATLPLNLYFRKNDGSRVRAYSHPAYQLLRLRPNMGESSVVFFEKLIRHIAYKGNAYVFKSVVEGKLAGLYLLNPDDVTEVYRDRETRFRYGGAEYGTDMVTRIPGLVTDDHGKGYALVDLARVAVQLGIQLDQFSLSSFGNGLNTKLLIDIAEMTADVQDLDQAQKIAQTVADYIHRNYSGAENAGKPLITWKGMKPTEIKGQTSNHDAELLESRKWQELEICKVFGVPPFLVNGTYDVKYGGLEQAMTVFLNFTLSPYLRHIEQCLAMGLLDAYEQERYYFEFDYNTLLRGSAADRSAFYSRLFAMGAISPGQIAAKENMEPPAEGADARFVPANMMPLRDDVLEAYMAKSKQVAEGLVSGDATPDPARAAGDDKL